MKIPFLVPVEETEAAISNSRVKTLKVRLKIAVLIRSTLNQILKRVAMKNNIHYSKQNKTDSTSVNAYLTSLGQQTSHSSQSLCFIPSNAIYYYVPPARKLVFSLQLTVAQCSILRYRGMKCKN